MSTKRQLEDEEEGEAKRGRLEGGVLLISGTNNWDPQAGKGGKSKKADAKGKKGKGKKAAAAAPPPPATERVTMLGPHVVSAMKDILVKEVYGGCSASHYGALTTDGELYLFGRNDMGQLGLGDSVDRDEPCLVPMKSAVVSVGIGRRHTIVVTDNGQAWAMGDNRCCQLGIGNNQNKESPTLIKHTVKFTKVACGAEFSMLLGEDGQLYSFGHPEHGMLGDDSEGKHIAKANKISFHYVNTPTQIERYCEKDKKGKAAAIEDVVITDVQCGEMHTCALDSKGRVFTWGFGGYGRLGHSNTANEMIPRAVGIFTHPSYAAKSITCSGMSCIAVTQHGVFYFWGQTKSSGEATMYPKVNHDCYVGDIRRVATGNKHIIVLCDSTVSWAGSPTFGELAYGEGTGKSSTKPKVVEPLEGIPVLAAAGGYAVSLFVADPSSTEAKALIDELPEY